MRMGFAVPVSGSWATPDNQIEIARAAERLGYASIWSFQRLLAPSEDDGGWAPFYRSVLDPLVSLGFLAATTSRVKLGVAVVNAPFFSPALLAKQLTTVDVLSGGRLVAGIGLGWSDEEYAASGVDKRHRGRRLAEHLDIVKRLWTQDAVTYDGEFYQLHGVRQDPKPVQRPHPPVLLGGSAAPALRRAGTMADGWVSASAFTPDLVRSAVAAVKTAAQEAGRDPDRLAFVCRGALRVRPEPQPDRPYAGPLPYIKERMAEVADAGITEFFVDLNFDPRIGSPDVDPAGAMDAARELLEAFAPTDSPTG